MRLIDADMLLNSFKGAKKLGVDAIKYYVDNTPTIDLITCGECKYYEESEYIEGDMVCKYHIGHTYYTEADRFCSYGERRSEC